MYRIHFDTSRGVWLIQFLKLGLFWFTVKRHISGPGDDAIVDETFDDLDAVDRYITAHGIDKVYRRVANPIEREPMFYVPGQAIPR